MNHLTNIDAATLAYEKRLILALLGVRTRLRWMLWIAEGCSGVMTVNACTRPEPKSVRAP